MNKLTITIDDSGTAQTADPVRHCRYAVPEALIRSAVISGRVRWQKNGQPWQPIVPMIPRLLPPTYPLSQLFLTAIASGADTPADQAAAKERLGRLCQLVGIKAGDFTKPCGELSPWQYYRQLGVLALLSPTPDIVILPSVQLWTTDEWRELTADSGTNKTLYFLGSKPDGRFQLTTEVENCDAGGQEMARTGNATVCLSAEAKPQSSPPQPAPKPPGVRLDTPLTELELAAAIQTLTILNEYSEQLLGRCPSVVVTGRQNGLNPGNDPTYDLSTVLQGRPVPEEGWLIVIYSSAEVVWGCLSQRRQPLPPGGTIIVAPGCQLRWHQMTTKLSGKPWRWLIGPGANVTVTSVAPEPLQDSFAVAKDAQLTGYEVAYASPSTNHNRSTAGEWHRLAISPSAVSTTGASWPPAPAVATLASHGVEEPWGHLLQRSVPWFTDALPIEYLVDLLALSAPR